MGRGSLEILKLDRLIHDPARLLILTFLYPVTRLDYLDLQKRLRLTTGNLSAQLQKLEKAGYVLIEKRFKGKYPQTICGMTKRGAKPLSSMRKC
jgi:DNA-binding MarR family transcriptional regulator